MAAGAELTTLNGAVYLFRLVSRHLKTFSFLLREIDLGYKMSGISAYREPYLFVTYFNSLDVIEILGHSSLG